MTGMADGTFAWTEENGPTPGKKYNVLVTTKPGMPDPNKPASEQKIPEKFKGTVEIPAKPTGELTIEVAE